MRGRERRREEKEGVGVRERGKEEEEGKLLR